MAAGCCAAFCMQVSLCAQTEVREAMAMDESVKKVAITFDDGPNPDYTEMLLSGLKERGVNATFFLLGKEVEQYPEIVKKIHEGGHLIGTHSYEHVNLSNLTDAAAIEQVDKTNAAIHAIIGEFPEYIRPPFGCWKPNLDYETTMIEVLWDVDPKDWATSNSSVIAQRVLGDVEENDIILLHDASESSVLAAFKIIDELKTQGYTFVTVEEILLDFVIGKGCTECSKTICEDAFGKHPTFADMMRHPWFEHLMNHPAQTEPFICSQRRFLLAQFPFSSVLPSSER